MIKYLLLLLSSVAVAQSPFVASTNAIYQRNDFSGFVGMKFTVGATPLTITSLGRICATGNTGTHIVKLADSNSVDVVGSIVSVSMTGCTAGKFVYTPLANAITLKANSTYYLVSQELMGGDKWYEFGSVTSSTIATVNNAVWYNGASYISIGAAGTSYVPPSFLYNPPSPSTPSSIQPLQVNEIPLVSGWVVILQDGTLRYVQLGDLGIIPITAPLPALGLGQ